MVKIPYDLKLFDPNLSAEEENHINRIAELMDKMDGIFMGYAIPEIYNSLSGMTAKVICVSENRKEDADKIVETIYQHTKENIQMAEQEGNALWSRKLQ